KLVARLERGRSLAGEPAEPRLALYRPFTREHLTGDLDLVDRPAIATRFFPDGVRSLGIAVPAPGNSAPPFMTLVTDVVPDLGLAGISAVQFFPRYLIEEREADESLFAALDEGEGPYRRIDNVTDEILADYQKTFGPEVT